MKEVVAIAIMVPMGMDFWASRRSPDLFEPAMIPGGGSQNRKSINGKSSKLYAVQFEPLWKSKAITHEQQLFPHHTVCGVWLSSNLTSDRREVDANQQSEECGDIVDYVRHVDVLGRVTSSER